MMITSQTYFFRFISEVWHIFLDSLCCALVLSGVCFILQMKYIFIFVLVMHTYVCIYVYMYLLTLADVGGEGFCNQVFCLYVCVTFIKICGQLTILGLRSSYQQTWNYTRIKTKDRHFLKPFSYKVMAIFTTHDCRFTTFRRLLVKEFALRVHSYNVFVFVCVCRSVCACLEILKEAGYISIHTKEKATGPLCIIV